jgi:hypothetical protein
MKLRGYIIIHMDIKLFCVKNYWPQVRQRCYIYEYEIEINIANDDGIEQSV